ncbi:MAG: thioredoxin-like domain-containing protein [Bacteroidota bacterium]|nr:thioredoxin-like domain-containing protein [Bacteroidota bacterium]
MKVKRLGLILFLIISLCYNVQSQNVFVSGSGKNIKGKKISLYSVADRFSGYVQKVDSIELKENDTTFSSSFIIDGVKELIVQIDLMKYAFVAEPGMKYYLSIGEFNFSQQDSAKAFMYGMHLPVSLQSEKYDRINSPLLEVDNLLGEYTYQNRRMLFIKDSLAVEGLLSLKDSLLIKYKDNEYISNYITYEFESILYTFYLKSRKTTKQNLFASSPILYDNIGYVDCFQTIFERYFSLGYKYISRKDMETWLINGNYSAFNDALGRDEILKNEVFRELVFLQGMKDAYLDGYFDKKLILNMLDKFKGSTKFEKHILIANNMINYLSRINATNTNIGNYKVRNIDQEIIELKSLFNEKPTLVAFVRLDDIACLKELESIHFCYDSVKENINIISICMDNNFEKMYNFIRNNKVGNKYKWHFVYFDNNYDMTSAFHLRMIPSFVLLDKEGKIIETPFESPQTGSLMKYKNKTQ